MLVCDGSSSGHGSDSNWVSILVLVDVGLRLVWEHLGSDNDVFQSLF